MSDTLLCIHVCRCEQAPTGRCNWAALCQAAGDIVHRGEGSLLAMVPFSLLQAAAAAGPDAPFALTPAMQEWCQSTQNVSAPPTCGRPQLLDLP